MLYWRLVKGLTHLIHTGTVTEEEALAGNFLKCRAGGKGVLPTKVRYR